MRYILILAVCRKLGYWIKSFYTYDEGRKTVTCIFINIYNLFF